MLQLKILESLKQPSLFTYLLVFLGGFILSFGSCNFIRLPVIVSCTSGLSSNRKTAFQFTLAFVSGLIFTYILYGFLLGIISTLAKNILALSIFTFYFTGFLLITFGLNLLGFLRFNFKISSFINRYLKKNKEVSQAFVLGILITLLDTPSCPYCGPIIFVMSASTIARGNIFYGLGLFFAYALGQSIALIVLGLSTSQIKYGCKLVEFRELIEVFAGIVLVYLGVYFIWLA
jgi:cytochrome c-type biogenesis protein